jgi:hypothetical protein
VNKYTILRYAGSMLLITGYIVLLNVNVFWGVVIRVVANILTLPWAFKERLWDLVTLLSIFLAIEVHELLKYVL